MGRKQDQAVSTKMPKASVGKPMERLRKQQHIKPRGGENSRQGLLKSKAGFTLYSESSDAAKPPRPKIQKSLISTQKQSQDEKEGEEQFLQQAEVVSQMQMQSELVKDGEASGIVIPGADCETHGDNTWYGNFDHPEFGTPFNKRLVSSTPDPERLLEAELLERLGNQSSMMCPQMIPEKDTAHPIKTTAVLATSANSLSEKLKVQRQKFQGNLQLVQQQQPHQQWQQHPQQYQNPLPPVPHSGNNALQHHNPLLSVPSIQSIPSNISVMAAPSTVTVAKAEWVVDVGGHHNLKKDKATSTLVQTTKSSKEDPSAWHTSSSVHSRFDATLSKTASNSDKAGDIVSAKTKVLTRVTQSATLVSDPDNVMHPFQAPANTHSSSKSFLSQPNVADDKDGKCSPLNHPSLKYETVSNRPDNNSSSGDKTDDTVKETLAHEESVSAFSKPDMSTGIHMMCTSYNLPSITRKAAFPESSTGSVEHSLAKPELAESPQKVVTYKPKGQDSVRAKQTQEIKKNNTMCKERVKHPSKENIDSSMKSKPHHNEAKRMEDLGVPKCNVPKLKDDLTNEDLDTSGDTCDMEVTNVLYEHKNSTNTDTREEGSRLNEKIYSKNNEDGGRESSASDSTNLSQVIEFLKSNAFNKVKESEADVRSINNYSSLSTDGIVDISIPPIDSQVDKQHDDSETLAELMRQYLPETDKSCANRNNNKCPDENVNDVDARSEDPDGRSCAKKDLEVNINQNHFSDENHDDERQTVRGPKNLQYLERMADPILRDIACRLALKATALRNVELWDLIDDMIFHTDAALGHEDARLQSAQMFFAEENSKLKKRIQSINQQLDAKERQERLGVNTLGFSNNDVLHLEKKIMYLRQEKEKLDNQVTTLLEEKAKWLITQQDLVRTISLKDHEILKLEEKHHEEKKSLLQSLDQATKNSQGVHYKLSVADREISNLEQCIKSRNVEIVNLKERLKETEAKLMECEKHSKLKDQEMLRLQDLVGSLKVGVDHVLQAYESSSNKDAATANRRQGMENLRQMVHPEEYRLSRHVLSDPGGILQAEHGTVPVQDPHRYHETFSSSQRTSVPKLRDTKELLVRPKYHYAVPLKPQPQKRNHSVEDSGFRAVRHSEHRSREDERGKLPRRLTPRTLEEHNRCLSPVDKTLWRSLDNEPKVSSILVEDPYYSDSEIEVNGHSRRRRSSLRHARTAGNLQQRSSIPRFGLSHKPASERVKQHQNMHEDDNGWDEFGNSQSTKYSTLRSETIPNTTLRSETIPDTTLRSETIPKSVGTHEVREKDHFSEDTYYSSLRSQPLSEKSHLHERNPVERINVNETHHPRSIPVSHPSTRHSHMHNINQRNVPHHSVGHQYEHVPQDSVPEHSRNLTDQEAHFATLQPEHLSADTHRISQHHAGTHPQTDFEAGVDQNFDQRGLPYLHHHHDEHLFNSTTQSSQELHRSLRSVDSGKSMSFMSPPHLHQSYSGKHPQGAYFRDTLDPFNSRQSVPLCESSSFPTRSSPTHLSDISISRRATRDSENLTQREFFQGTELSASLSTISEADIPSSNNNQLNSLNENPFSTGIASLDEKIANLQRKIDRTKAMFS